MSKLLRYSIFLLCFILLLWGVLALLQPKDDGILHVVLDPGHGGSDPGAVVGEVCEKDINLAVSLLVNEYLSEQENVVVTMTRAEDVYLTLSERSDLANQEKADLYVSIHANALENNTDFSGIYTFYHPRKRSSKTPAEIIQASIIASSGGIDRGVRSEDYAVLRETDMPAVLVETGFMTCPDELSKLVDPNYQRLLAQGIAQGILEYGEK